MNMKSLLRLLTICCAISLTTVANAELLPYPIDTVNGQAVYKYRVPHSIGIYRISVNFGVTQEDIIKWNPQLKERGLHYDELILIPVMQKAGTSTRTAAGTGDCGYTCCGSGYTVCRGNGFRTGRRSRYGAKNKDSIALALAG